jgi:hypothetical protein
MDNNMPDKSESVMNEALLATGNTVGNLAKEYFGEFIEADQSKGRAHTIAETKKLLDAGTKVIAEAAFEYNGDYCRVDILRVTPSGYEIIEVKSGSGSADETADDVKDIFLHDISFQTYILTKCGLNITSAQLMLINRDYVREGDLDIHSLFVLIDCTDAAFELQEEIAQIIDVVKKVASQEAEPVMDIGGRCDKPYACGYKKWCFKDLPENNIFVIGWSKRMAKKEEAYKVGIISFQDALNAFESGKIKLTERQERQVRHTVGDLEPHVNLQEIKAFLSTVRYPLYFLDYETFQAAVPPFDNVSPFEQIPFQYSVHIQKERGGETLHKEFLGKEGQDPRRDLADRLCKDIPENACVVSYNMGFEKMINRLLANLFPDLSAHLLNMNDNMIDLMDPFKTGAYYIREIGGGFSIKVVLPALFPDDPELNYKSLDKRVQSGGDAMNLFPVLHLKSPEEIIEDRKALLAYCRLDTLAMVKVLDKLYEIAEGE